MVTGTPWGSGGETTVHHTSIGGEIRSNRRLRGMLPKESATHRTIFGHDLMSCAQERTAQLRPEPRRGSQFHQVQQHRISSQRQRQHRHLGSTSEDIEPAVSSRAHATSDHLSREVTKQWNGSGPKANDSVLWPVFLSVLC